MKALADLAETSERMARAGDFVRLAHTLALYKGVPPDPDALRGSVSERVREVLKASVLAGGVGWAQELVAPEIARGFIELLRHSSIFYGIVRDIVPLAFNINLGVVLTGAGAAVDGPGIPHVVTKLGFAGMMLEQRKAGAIVVLSEQLVREIGVGERLIGRELRNGVAEAVDNDVVSNILLDGVTAIPSSGEPLADLRTLLDGLAPTAESRLYWLASPAVAIRIATAGSTPTTGSPGLPSGQRLFPDATATGGSLLGYPMLVSSAIAAGELLLVDAARLAGKAETITLFASGEADVEMDAAPGQSMGAGSPLAPVGAQMVSLWQTNSVGIKATAYYGLIRVPGSTPVAAVQGIAW